MPVTERRYQSYYIDISVGFFGGVADLVDALGICRDLQRQVEMRRHVAVYGISDLSKQGSRGLASRPGEFERQLSRQLRHEHLRANR